VPTHSVGVALFYDENGNGLPDSAEAVRIPDAVVEIGGKQGRSAPLTGEAIIDGVPDGSQTLIVRASSLPPYYEPPAPVTIAVPQTAGTTFVPVTLPIGSNRPNVYLAFGDSITGGEGSTDGEGYASRLQQKLETHLGRATIVKDGLTARAATAAPTACRAASGCGPRTPSSTTAPTTGTWGSASPSSRATPSTACAPWCGT
jgi:hypothetical protein